MIEVKYLEGSETLTLLDNYDDTWTLDQVLTEIRRVWHESDGDAVFFFFCRGMLWATMTRFACDVHTAHTLYADGRTEEHTVEYVVDPADGCYLGTLIRDSEGNSRFFEYGTRQ